VASRHALKPLTDYFLNAVQAVRQNKQRYAEAAAQAAMQKKSSFGLFPADFLRSLSMQAPDEE
jgi:hypothetical protein